MNTVKATAFGRVAVMLGGLSSERDVSLQTGNAVYKALLARGIDVHRWDPADHTLAEFAAAKFSRVWIALHGPGGEDGAIQGALQWLDVPYTGSGVMASALAMDKVRSKHLFRQAGIPTPDYAVAKTPAEATDAAAAIGFPLIIKPSGQGSSVGMSKVSAPGDLDNAVAVAFEFGDTILLETCVEGDEFTVSILDGEALPTIRISTPRVFYDYRAKYESDSTEYVCPGTSSTAAEQSYKELALAAFSTLGCSGWGRVDFMAGADGKPQVLEVNTVPGMTSHSLVPMAAQAAGMDFEVLCVRILETSFASRTDVADVKVAANGA